MGQYHILVNVDKREYLHPAEIGLGVKQWEHQSEARWPLYGSLSDAMYILTMTSPARGGGDMPGTEISGRWAGDRVMVVGDYTEDEDLPAEFLASQIYGQAQETYEEIGSLMRDAFTQVYGLQWESEEYPSGNIGWSRIAKAEVSA
jgi:uncharacterized protein YjbJ (UPF0337 family)